MAKKRGVDLREMEQRWGAYWEESGIYRWDPATPRSETFVVDTPPPTVSGALHVGHVFSFTHTDLMVRFQRMRGKNIFYPMGWDDNGLPTERRVQNLFNVRCDPSRPYDPELELEVGRQGDALIVSRPNFIELCDYVVTQDEAKFKETFQRLGLSVDWNETFATIGERSRYVSQLSFLRLVDRGLAELRDAPTMWDVDYQSAVAQAEVEDRERDGAFYRVRFGVEAGGELLVATTRPELLPACIAVVAHPEDKRYEHLIGKTAITPLFAAPVPILADAGADPDKGTGILMVCTFGDAADVEKWREMGVPAREVVGRDGRLLAAPWGEAQWSSRDPDAARLHHDKLAGLTINQARRATVDMLNEAGAIEGEPLSIRRPVKFYERGERPLEFVVSRQWFIRVMDKKEALIEQGRKVQWHPDMFRKRYENWVEGLNQDWSISRQRYFGVPIPVWYAVRNDGSIDYQRLILPRLEDLPVDASTDAPPGYTNEQRGAPGGFAGDPDVFDTWATSALTPLIPSGWPHDTRRHQSLYPADLRPQAHDIIRTWAFVTITRAFLEDGSIPWRHAAISGWVLDPERKKLSKSKGNFTVVPSDILDEHGSDSARYWSASARLGVDTAFDPGVFREGKRLVTKILNASRLVKGYAGESGPPSHPVDLALLSRLRSVVQAATTHWESWNHAGALTATETWFWADFCDNYLELSKLRAYDGDPSALGTLRLALDVVLRLFAPVLVYVTEEVWNSGAAQVSSIHRAAWPTVEELPAAEDDGTFGAVVAVLFEVRRLKSAAEVSIRAPVDRMEIRGPSEKLELLEPAMGDVCAALAVSRYELRGDERHELSVEVAFGDPPPNQRS